MFNIKIKLFIPVFSMDFLNYLQAQNHENSIQHQAVTTTTMMMTMTVKMMRGEEGSWDSTSAK